MPRGLLRHLVLAAALGGTVAGVRAQQPVPPVPAAPTFRTEAELVVLHVSVRDRHGRYVPDLGQGAFTVVDDGQRQELAMFSAVPVPASIALLIDNSHSMGPSRERVMAAAEAFASHSDQRDEISVFAFNEAVLLAFGPAIVRDMPAGALSAALRRGITARGLTAIYDAVLAGLQRVSRGAHTRQVLIVVSDGEDNASEATRQTMLEALRQADATVYAVTLVDPVQRGGDPGLMRRIARETGGEAHQPRRPSELPAIFDRIAADIRTAYTLAYVPSHAGDAAGDRRRAVQVYVRDASGQPLSVRTRDGYFERHEGAPRP